MMALSKSKINLSEITKTWSTQIAFDVDPVRKILSVETNIGVGGSYYTDFKVEYDGAAPRFTADIDQAIEWYNNVWK